MSKVKVVGFSESKGTYKGYDFHNLVVHCLRTDEYCCGERAEQKKVKWHNIPAVFGLNLPVGELSKVKVSDFSDCIGKYANVYYDQYGNLDKFDRIFEETKK